MGSNKKQAATFSCSTKDELVRFQLQIGLSTEFRFFYTTKELPEFLRALERCPPGERRYFDTYHELRQEVEALIAEFEISLIEETKTRVILYHISFDDTGGKHVLEFKYLVAVRISAGGHRKHDSVRFFLERQYNGRSTGTALDEISSYQIDSDRLEMAWTKEREAWFRAMEDSVRSLGQKLTAGFGTVPEVLARKIDQSAQFLLTGGDPK